MWEYFVQNIELWILAVFGVAAILMTLYYQIFVWRSNDRDFSVPVIVTFMLGFVGSFILPSHVPYPPFTWVQWLRENIPSSGCGGRGVCWQEVPYFFAFMLLGLAIGAVCLVILWGPWRLSPWGRQYLENSKAEEVARELELAREAEAARLAVAAQPFRRVDMEGIGEQDESGPIGFDPADRVRYCEHCGRFLKRDSPILGIEHCPTCDGPLSRRVLMRWFIAAFWGAAGALGFSLVFSFFVGDIDAIWFLSLFLWPFFTLFHALNKILPEFHGFGGGNGGG